MTARIIRLTEARARRDTIGARADRALLGVWEATDAALARPPEPADEQVAHRPTARERQLARKAAEYRRRGGPAWRWPWRGRA